MFAGVIGMSVPVQEPSMTCMLWDDFRKMHLCQYIVQYHAPSKKLTISCKLSCLREVMVVIDLFLPGCTGSEDCDVYLLSKGDKK